MYENIRDIENIKDILMSLDISNIVYLINFSCQSQNSSLYLFMPSLINDKGHNMEESFRASLP